MKDSDLIRRSDVYKEVQITLMKDVAEFLIGWLDDIPAVDAVEVVRCRECWRWGKPQVAGEEAMCKYIGSFTEPDFFCKDGQRREDGENVRSD